MLPKRLKFDDLGLSLVTNKPLVLPGLQPLSEAEKRAEPGLATFLQDYCDH